MVADIRIKTSFLGHRKRRKLSMLLGQDATGYLLDLWLHTAMTKPSGVLCGMDAEDIALDAGFPGDAKEFVCALEQVGFLDRAADGTLSLHDWQEHQAWVVNEPARKARAQKASRVRWSEGEADQPKTGQNGAEADKSTSPAACDEQPEMPEVGLKSAEIMHDACSADAQRMQHGCAGHAPGMLPAMPLSSPSPSPIRTKNPPVLSSESTSPPGGAYAYPPAFEAWWKLYPKKVAKPYAWKCWKKIKGVGADVLIGALERQLAVPNLGHFQRGDKVCLPDPSTWLNKGRWEDEVVAAALSAAAKLRSMAEKEEQ